MASRGHGVVRTGAFLRHDAQRPRPFGRRARLGAACFALMLAPGCAMLRDNVKGSFACKAPDGTCAPSSVIDDAALAAIADTQGYDGPASRTSGEHGAPATRATARRLRRDASAGMLLPESMGRGERRALRVVFLPHVDRFGQLHERAVVQLPLADDAGAISAASAHTIEVRDTVPGGPSLVDLADQAPQIDDAVPSSLLAIPRPPLAAPFAPPLAAVSGRLPVAGTMRGAGTQPVGDAGARSTVRPAATAPASSAGAAAVQKAPDFPGKAE